MGIRRKGRELAFQTLYALEFEETTSEYRELELLNLYEVKLDEVCQNDSIEIDNPIYKFAHEIIKNTLTDLERIDATINSSSDNWPIDKQSSIDRAILRIITCELLSTKTAPAVLIDEAIEIAKKFSSESSSKFINGVLDKLSHKIDKE